MNKDQRKYMDNYRENYSDLMREQIKQWFKMHPYYCKKMRNTRHDCAKNYSKKWRNEHLDYYKKYLKKNNNLRKLLDFHLDGDSLLMGSSTYGAMGSFHSCT